MYEGHYNLLEPGHIRSVPVDAPFKYSSTAVRLVVRVSNKYDDSYYCGGAMVRWYELVVHVRLVYDV